MAGGTTPSRRFGHTTEGFHRDVPVYKHVWVKPMPAPGVLIEWRRGDNGWEAHVVYVDAGRVIVCWLPAAMVHPAV